MTTTKEVPLWPLDDCDSTAILSSCDRYRYLLTRRVKDDPRRLPWILWLMLNPSTATAVIPDPTIKKCFGFTWRAGYYGFRVVNLFGLRATYPKDLLQTITNEGEDEAIGAANNEHLITGIRDCHAAGGLVVLAWGEHGNNRVVRSRVADVMQQIRHEQARCAEKGSGELSLAIHCLGMTKGKNGAKVQPKHPLMVGYKQPIVPVPNTYFPRAAA